MKNIYFIFSHYDIDDLLKKENMDLYTKFKINLNLGQWKRLFCSTSKLLNLYADTEINVYMIELVSNFVPCSRIEYDNYNNDCNNHIFNIINNNQELFGYSSTYQNKIIASLLFNKHEPLDANSIIKELNGDNGWNSLSAFFEFLANTNCSYVVLRKYEKLPKSFIDDDKDIDILCLNREHFKLLTNATKRSFGISGFQIKVKDQYIPIDIRYKGDNYLDSAWEENILMNRICNNSGIYVMNKENQIYSIIYHILTQKKEISQYYQRIIENEITFNNVDELLTIIISYMKNNGYLYNRPKDISVYQNKKHCYLIKKKLNKPSFVDTIIYIIIRILPDRIIPTKIRNSLLNRINN